MEDAHNEEESIKFFEKKVKTNINSQNNEQKQDSQKRQNQIEKNQDDFDFGMSLEISNIEKSVDKFSKIIEEVPNNQNIIQSNPNNNADLTLSMEESFIKDFNEGNNNNNNKNINNNNNNNNNSNNNNNYFHKITQKKKYKGRIR